MYTIICLNCLTIETQEKNPSFQLCLFDKQFRIRHFDSIRQSQTIRDISTIQNFRQISPANFDCRNLSNFVGPPRPNNYTTGCRICQVFFLKKIFFFIFSIFRIVLIFHTIRIVRIVSIVQTIRKWQEGYQKFHLSKLSEYL